MTRISRRRIGSSLLAAGLLAATGCTRHDAAANATVGNETVLTTDETVASNGIDATGNAAADDAPIDNASASATAGTGNIATPH